MNENGNVTLRNKLKNVSLISCLNSVQIVKAKLRTYVPCLLLNFSNFKYIGEEFHETDDNISYFGT